MSSLIRIPSECKAHLAMGPGLLKLAENILQLGRIAFGWWSLLKTNHSTFHFRPDKDHFLKGPECYCWLIVQTSSKKINFYQGNKLVSDSASHNRSENVFSLPLNHAVSITFSVTLTSFPAKLPLTRIKRHASGKMRAQYKHALTCISVFLAVFMVLVSVWVTQGLSSDSRLKSILLRLGQPKTPDDFEVITPPWPEFTIQSFLLYFVYCKFFCICTFWIRTEGVILHLFKCLLAWMLQQEEIVSHSQLVFVLKSVL